MKYLHQFGSFRPLDNFFHRRFSTASKNGRSRQGILPFDFDCLSRKQPALLCYANFKTERNSK